MSKVLVCADLHGRDDLWNEIKEFLNKDDILYILGDSADRGADGWNMIKEALDMPNVIYILGNHDVMLLNSLNNREVGLHIRNGGSITLDSLANDKNYLRYIEKLRHCPYNVIYKNKKNQIIYMNHSGCISSDPREQVWDRTHYLDHDNHGYDFIIHGHTPIEIMVDDFNHYNKFFSKEYQYEWIQGEVCYYNGGNKINIDCGAYWYGFTILLDLDTFEEYIIGEVTYP